MMRFLFLAILFTTGLPGTTIASALTTVSDDAPPWVGDFRVRYELRVHGDLENPPHRTGIAQIPTGGWLRQDAADLHLADAAGHDVPLAVLLHDPAGDTVIQFQIRNNQRRYWLYASDPNATGRDPALRTRLAVLKEEAERSLLAKMAASTESGRRTAAYRELQNGITKAEAELEQTIVTLDESRTVLETHRATVASTENDLAVTEKMHAAAVDAHAPMAAAIEDTNRSLKEIENRDAADPSALEAAREEAYRARMAAAPTASTLDAQLQARDRERANLEKHKHALAKAHKHVESTRARKNALIQKLDSFRSRLDASAAQAEAAQGELKTAVTGAHNASDAYTEAAIEHDPRLFQEGLTVEYRRWKHENLGSWPEVVKDLHEPGMIQGNAAVVRVLQNVNPFNRAQPRHYAVSYRGFLNIQKPGLYRFFVNGEDASFLFINGYLVTSRTGPNRLLFRGVKTYAIGGTIELEVGIHPFQIHQVVGNTVSGSGQCTFMWMTPEATGWSFLPREALTESMTAVVTGIEAHDGRQLATFEHGMDSSLASDDVSLFLMRFQAKGLVHDPQDLVWNFGDGPTDGTTTVIHPFFGVGAREVSLRSHPDLPPFRRRVSIWTPPTPTSPLALRRAVQALELLPIDALDTPRLYETFHFLNICRQPERWPVLERTCLALLKRDGLDIKTRALISTSLMQAMAQQGRASDALEMAEQFMARVGHIRTLRAMLLFQAAEINREVVRDEAFAEQLYVQIIEENQRLLHPIVRKTAITRGDMHLNAGDLPRAADAYRLATTLGGNSLFSGTNDNPVRRGGLLRIAEQQIKRGNLRQALRTMKRIESEYPQQKLEGMFRYLSGEADRLAGRYESALRHYEILLQLRQWRGYRGRAMQGIADTYFRMGRHASALEWMRDLKEEYPDFYQEQDLEQVRRTVETRLAGDADDSRDPFSVMAIDFEPESIIFQDHHVMPGMGIDGPHTFLIHDTSETTTSLPVIPLRNLPSQGSLWLELWYRDRRGAPYKSGRRLEISIHVQKDRIHHQRVELDPTYGSWHKFETALPSPRTSEGSLSLTLYNRYGLIEIDGVKISHVSDRQNDALIQFIEGADPQ